MSIRRIIISLGICISVLACQKKPETLFELVPSDHSGLTFNNVVTDSDTFNILTEEYIYNGGGVAVGDFNNDSLVDIFFTGNTVGNKLYINQGELKFQDVTDRSLTQRANTWSSGAVVVDINADGWDDIYVTATMQKDSSVRANMLYVNQGKTSDGIPLFKEEANAYGIDDTSYSTMATFFDYDLDGDLDLYILVNQHLSHSPSDYRFKLNDGTSPSNDRLYRNEGNGKFTNVTKQAGILFEGYGLGLATADFNLDGWPDLYISNDFVTNDILYLNNQDGTFSNVISTAVGHQSHSSMGNDAADFTNDGMPDIVTVDMLPETNERKKTTINTKSYTTYINNKKYSYDPQYVRNMLHVNNNLGHGIKFSEVGQLSGVYQTEWSWAPLFADLDNDGLKDLFITNGFPKDITDKDFSNYREEVERFVKIRNLLDSIPTVKIPNYVFKNKGNLAFEDVSNAWGITHPSYSNGAAYADLDNDGDLDFVINNINDQAFVYRNTLNDDRKADSAHFIRVKLQGNKSNTRAIGAKVHVYYGGKAQYFENYVARGYLSSVDGIIHAGLGKHNKVDSLVVIWPDLKKQVVKDVNVDRTIVISYQPSEIPAVMPNSGEKESLMTSYETAKLNFRHEEEDRIDYNIQRTLPHKFSQYTPGIAVGDVNNDRLEDFVVGGSYGKTTTLFLQQGDGSFKSSSVQGNITKSEEDMGLLLFDCDNDGDIDLYTVSGSIEHEPTSAYYQDALFKNDGTGKFVRDATALPAFIISGSCVRGSDFDVDGDIDLFVGGRVIPGQYPLPASSYVLENKGGTFTVHPASTMMDKLGMVTDALFTDVDSDGHTDLMVAGEFMAITVFKGNGKSFEKLYDTGLERYTGWWNSLVGSDFDNDGDTDYIAGNLGDNNNYQVSNEHPLRVVAKDFDMNGSIDAILGCYMKELQHGDSKQMFPVHFWDELNSQSPRFRNQFVRYRQYARTSLVQLLKPEDMEGALTLDATILSSCYLENKGKGKFAVHILPTEVQVAPVNGIVCDDVNMDGNQDVIMVGNDYGNEVFAGRYDAFNGLVLLGDGRGQFKAMSTVESGFYVPGDAKGLARIAGKQNDLFVATQNQDSLKIFSLQKDLTLLRPEMNDVYATITFADGRKQRHEFYFGSGFLSQSSRALRLSKNIVEVRIINSKGEERVVKGPLQ